MENIMDMEKDSGGRLMENIEKKRKINMIDYIFRNVFCTNIFFFSCSINQIYMMEERCSIWKRKKKARR